MTTEKLTVQLGVRVPQGLKTLIEEAAKAENRTTNNFVVHAIRFYLRERAHHLEMMKAMPHPAHRVVQYPPVISVGPAIPDPGAVFPDPHGRPVAKAQMPSGETMLASLRTPTGQAIELSLIHISEPTRPY